MPSVQRSHIQLCTSSLYISTYTNPCYVLSCHKNLPWGQSGRFFVGGVSSSEVAKKIHPTNFYQHRLAHLHTCQRTLQGILLIFWAVQPWNRKSTPKTAQSCARHVFFFLRGTMLKKHVGVVRCLQVDYHKNKKTLWLLPTLSILTPQNWLFWGPYPCVRQVQTVLLEGPMILRVQYFEILQMDSVWVKVLYIYPKATKEAILKTHRVLVLSLW